MFFVFHYPTFMVINNTNTINNFEWNSETVLALRVHIGNSQTKLANELGVRQQTISAVSYTHLTLPTNREV